MTVRQGLNLAVMLMVDAPEFSHGEYVTFVILGIGLALGKFEEGDQLLLALFFVSEGYYSLPIPTIASTIRYSFSRSFSCWPGGSWPVCSIRKP